MDHMMQVARMSNKNKGNQFQAFMEELSRLDDSKLEEFSRMAISKGIDRNAIQEGMQMIRSLKRR